MRAFVTIFRDWRYALGAVTVCVAVFALSVWLPNLRLLVVVWADFSIALSDKFSLSISLLPSIATNFTFLSASYTVAIAVLAGINVAFMTHLVRRQRGQILQAGATVGMFGILSGTAGVGCTACGSLIVGALLGTIGGAGVLALLPFGGGEFGIIGAALLGYSMHLLAKQITKPSVCEPANIKL